MAVGGAHYLLTAIWSIAMGSLYEQAQQPNDEGSMDKRAEDVPSDKISAAHSGTREHVRWSRWDKQSDAPAPPPVWTRYIESRLRQFGETR